MIYYLYASSFGNSLWLRGFADKDRGYAKKDEIFVGTFELDMTVDEYNWRQRGICNPSGIPASKVGSSSIHIHNRDTVMNEAELRELFAGLAMQALIARPDKEGRMRGDPGVPLICKYAYEYADAMIEAREPKHEQKAFY